MSGFGSSFSEFQACAYFSQAICPIPIYTTGCKTKRSCLVSCCLSKRNLSWRSQQLQTSFIWESFCLAPKHANNETTAPNQGPGQSPAGQHGERQAWKQKKDLETRLRLFDSAILVQLPSSTFSSDKWRTTAVITPHLRISSSTELHHSSNNNDNDKDDNAVITFYVAGTVLKVISLSAHAIPIIT